MTAPALRFQRVVVDRVPGIARGDGFALVDLAPGVNLILGPNGSGKTLTGRVLLDLVWPGEAGLERPSAAGTWVLDGSTWEVELDAGHATWRRDGRPAEPPALPSAATRSHHWLGLRELLVDGGPDADANRAFARRIANEMLGGADVDAAMRRLGFARTPSRSRKLTDALREAEERLREARQAERAVADRLAGHADLQRRIDRASDAGVLARRLGRAVELRDAEAAVAALEARLEAFPAGMATLRGDERRRLDALAIRRNEVETRTREAAARRDAAQARLDGLGGSGRAVSTAELQTLAAEVRRLGDLERASSDARSRLAAARAAEDAARRVLGDTVDPDRIAAVGPVAPETLRTLARDAADLARRHRDLDAEAEAITAARARLETTGDDAGDLERARLLLGQWLRTPGGADPVAAPAWSVPLLAAAVLVAVLVVLLGVLVAPTWLVLLTAAVVLAVLAKPRGAAAPTGDPRPSIEREYAGVSCGPVPAWTVDAVQSALDEVLRRRADAIQREREREAVEARASEVRALERALERDAARFEEARREAESALGIPLAPDRADWLPLLGVNLAAWREAALELPASTADADTVEREREDVARTVAATLRRLGDETVDASTPIDAATASGRFEALRERTTAYREATEAHAHAVRDLEQAAADRTAVERDAATVFEDAGIDAANEPELDRRLAARDGWLELRDELARLRIERNVIAGELGDLVETWRDRDRAALETAAAEAAAIAADLDPLNRELGGLQTELARALEGRGIEDAERALDAARGALLDERAENERAAAGAAVGDWLQASVQARIRPAVLRLSDDLFRRITLGRYELRVDRDDDLPVFIAWDHRDERAKRLEELSAGERVQLLLSVRLGFLDHEEGGVRLPLVLDEILGTTDDERARAIIDAVLEISRSGRQVFYFTAQPDEIGKWLGRLEERGAEDAAPAVIDLAAVRGLAEADARPLPVERPETPLVPAPEGMGHAAYGRRLAVSGIDPRIAVGRLHPWHLIDDPEPVHALVRRGMRSWGPIAALTARGALPAGVDDATMARARARAAALRQVFDAWACGRGRPVDRDVLARCPAVSERFIEALVELAEALGGDADALLGALEEGRVPRWQKNKTVELREQLEASGHLDPAPVLRDDEIRVRGLAALPQPVDDADAAWLERILAALPAEPAPARERA